MTTPTMFINSIVSATFILFAKIVESNQNIHLPPIFIELLQVSSYCGAIAVSSFTVYNFIKKRNAKR